MFKGLAGYRYEVSDLFMLVFLAAGRCLSWEVCPRRQQASLVEVSFALCVLATDSGITLTVLAEESLTRASV